MTDSGALILVAAFLLGLLVYFAHYPVARSRGHRNASAIDALNFFPGWTFLGWVASIVWAYSDNMEAE